MQIIVILVVDKHKCINRRKLLSTNKRTKKTNRKAVKIKHNFIFLFFSIKNKTRSVGLIASGQNTHTTPCTPITRKRFQ